MSPKPMDAALVRLKMKQFGNTREDKAISAEVKLAHAMKGEAGKWVKNKLPPEYLGNIAKKVARIRGWFGDYTLPWEEPYRLVTAASRPKLLLLTTEWEKELNALIKEAGDNYPVWLEEAKAVHGDTFNPSDYPADEGEFMANFGFNVSFSPVPMGSQLPAAFSHLYAKDVDEMYASKLKAAETDLWTKLCNAVNHAFNKLKSEDEKFKDSLIDNIKFWCALVPELNVNNSPQLLKFAEECKQQLAILDPEELRKDKEKRKKAAATALTMLNNHNARKFVTEND